MKTLLINAHPDFDNPESYSNTLEQKFMNHYNEKFEAEDLTVLNLYDMEIPRIEKGQLLSVWTKEADHIGLTSTEQHIADQSAELLKQLKDNQRVVISLPTHNFNVPSKLKDWIDNILIARETFKYLSQPLASGQSSRGLMTNDYRLMILIASGSIYTRDDFYSGMDFAVQYLKAIFAGVMAFGQVNIVRAEGTSIMPISRENILNAAFAELDTQFNEFYEKQ
ncbi:FMN-dependent NADH-azoreductase [Furfurilactobacillus milii]|uniref:FMN dependent NADH:quinone oxidoreductase n=1 Tax=Furfurilactobacillus milii TaxID=2888272 RepID=A0A6N9I3Y6_9LACO|nr:NAD(P)H-dependent oxidoreductase [Furfurilactobacillus milii]MYV17701.1 FMN-dependent NADH-azoreductase [Furfurilactobacillus milii]